MEFKKKRSVWYLSMVLLLVVSTIVSMNITISPKRNNLYAESIVDYALKWVDNKSIPYVYGGGHGLSLEEIESKGCGTDCSGFVMAVYKHFGVALPGSSSAMQSSAKKVMYNASEALPGDVCWWSGHVAIYIGDNKIVHTNTAKAPNNYIHITEFGTSYPTPSAFLRFTDSGLGAGSGGSSGGSSSGSSGSSSGGGGVDAQGNPISSETQDKVKNAVSTGVVLTESDLTGMPTESSLLFEQQQLSMKSREDMTIQDLERLEYIEAALKAQDVTASQWYYRFMSVIGLVLIIYAGFIMMCFLFDKTNNFIDLSALAIISLGRWRLVNKYDVDDGLIKPGYDKESNITYLTTTTIFIRAFVVLAIGLFLISGLLGNWVTEIVSYFLGYWG